jgi:hypothetical protein
MIDREQVIANMASDFAALPEWMRNSFEPFRETVALLLDRGNEELARAVVAAIPVPANFDAAQVATFNTAVSSVLTGIDSIIAARTCNQPEYIAAYEASVLKRISE